MQWRMWPKLWAVSSAPPKQLQANLTMTPACCSSRTRLRSDKPLTSSFINLSSTNETDIYDEQRRHVYCHMLHAIYHSVPSAQPPFNLAWLFVGDGDQCNVAAEDCEGGGGWSHKGYQSFGGHDRTHQTGTGCESFCSSKEKYMFLWN